MFNSDFQQIGDDFYSPTFGYPAQRIRNYDMELIEHVTLNGLGQSPYSKRVAPQKDWENRTMALSGSIGSHGESHANKKLRKYSRVFNW